MKSAKGWIEVRGNKTGSALNREAAGLRPNQRRPKQDDELAEFEKPHRTADVACGGAH